MKESVIERNKRLHIDEHIAQFRAKMQQPYAFWMKTVGWGDVLDYIGVEWRQEGRQMSLLPEIDEMQEEAT